MEDDQKIQNGRWQEKMEDDQNKFKMEDNQRKFKMEDDKKNLTSKFQNATTTKIDKKLIQYNLQTK